MSVFTRVFFAVAAKARPSEQQLRTLLQEHTADQQFGFEEPRVNLQLNLALGRLSAQPMAMK
jgi:K+-transporting ATPase c subunit